MSVEDGEQLPHFFIGSAVENGALQFLDR